MFTSISYDKKLKILGLVSLLSIFLCYRYAIKETMAQYKDFNNYKKVLELNVPATSSTEKLVAREKQMEMLFSRFELDTLQPYKNLLFTSGIFCGNNHLKLKEYRLFHFSECDSIRLLTRIVSIEGEFAGCLKMIYQLETLEIVGRVSSVEFKSYLDPQDKKTKLTCTLYVQNLISYSHENN
ncbi:MAG TPA: hypothetical protein VGG71_13475 [Chitinophagaceae bacterium]|jgi:hypothetical protein